MTATRGLGTILNMGTKKIGGLTEIGGLDLTADTIDTTTLDSDGGYKEFIGGFKDGGEVSLSGYLDVSTGSGQKDFYDAFEAGSVNDFTIKFPSSIGASWNFKGVVTGFKTSTNIDDPLSFEGTIKVSGKPTLQIGASGA
ncbi:hypothetical protein AN964_14060 [Heyndrickxia shackletonii]|uniref:Lambda phage tail tube protein N-terminal domain-containing protein n=1 Tax=Heyndrickxia shackletonii TaxID=157838 RepID=A0A0Q3TKI8_9BACI|nr:phage tail tube protein [Heyndrickxia shackletonii]KQL54510.1 hypothetical protein AN964_14060 [Heyndrickxia shackletonii]NEY99242.1 hypothetical protein [Heyndrickxia shackletonii]